MKNPDPARLELFTELIRVHGDRVTNARLSELTGIHRGTCHRYKKYILTHRTVSPETHEKAAGGPTVSKSYKIVRQAMPQATNAACGNRLRMVVGLPDMHLPYDHGAGIYSPAMRAVLRFLDDTRPDEVVVMGDMLDLASVAPWNKDRPGRITEHSLGRDFAAGNMALDTMQQLTHRVTYLEGNHEAWLTQAMERDIGLRGHLELAEALRLYDRGIQLVPENGVYPVGKANLIHGWYTGVYHARAHADAAMDNMFYGHTHDIQAFSKVKWPGEKPIIAQSCGCLCQQNPHYLRNKPNRWAAGLLVLYVADDGTFSHYVPVITRGGFIFNGKEYSTK